MASHVSKNIDQESVEKDWWVTTVLKAFFELSIAKFSFFKGGTSLSKGWNIINRFSEDIDIALYRDYFLKVKGMECAKCENNNQIKMLRKASRDFVTGELKDELEKKLEELKQAMDFCIKKRLVKKEELARCLTKQESFNLGIECKIRMDLYLKKHPEEKP
jgi:predicted nucleotidyltransferase component of viral defense system